MTGAGRPMKKMEEGKTAPTEAMAQNAALCFRTTRKRGAEVLLVTSRDTGRWVIPKGWPMGGKSGAECALQEAFEEAGVEGRLVAGTVGIYSYDKMMDDGSLQPCVVSVYPVEVARLKSNFPERGQRDRRWFNPRKAARKVAEPELSTILAGFDPAQLTDADGGSA